MSCTAALTLKRAGALLGAVAIGACSTACAIVNEPPRTPAPSSTQALVVATTKPDAIDIDPVSRSQPSAEAADVFRKCQIGDTIRIDMVSAMGKVPSAADLVRFVPLTGREPQLKSAGAAWVIQIRGDVPQYMEGTIWTNPTCVVTDEIFGYFATGTTTTVSSGVVATPEPPAVEPDLTLPPLAP